MSDNKPERKFMKSLLKATVLVLLPITLAFSAGALGFSLPEHETQSKTPRPDVSTTLVSSSKRITAPAAAPLEPVIFSNAVDTTVLLKSYPFLKDIVDEVAASNATGVFSFKTSLNTATFKDEKTKTNLLFVKLNGSDYCGSAGCSMLIYSDNGNGYRPVTTISSAGSLFITRDEKGISIVDCRGDGPRQLRFSNGTFTQQKPVLGNATKACPPPEP